MARWRSPANASVWDGSGYSDLPASGPVPALGSPGGGSLPSDPAASPRGAIDPRAMAMQHQSSTKGRQLRAAALHPAAEPDTAVDGRGICGSIGERAPACARRLWRGAGWTNGASSVFDRRIRRGRTAPRRLRSLRPAAGNDGGARRPRLRRPLRRTWPQDRRGSPRGGGCRGPHTRGGPRTG